MAASNPVDRLLQPDKPSGAADVDSVPYPADFAQQFRIAVQMPLHEMIQSECGQQTHSCDGIQLYVDRGARHGQQPPAQDHRHVQGQNRQSRRHMRGAQFDEHVMQVRLIGMKGRRAFQDAG